MERGSAGDVHHGTLPGGEQVGQEGTRDVHEGGNVQGNLGCDGVRVFLDQRTVGAETGVVDQGVDGDSAAGQFVEELASHSCAAQVHGGEDGHCDAVACAQVLSQLFQTVCTPGHKDKVGAPPGSKLSGELSAQAGAGARDECSGACVCHGHGGIQSVESETNVVDVYMVGSVYFVVNDYIGIECSHD